MQQEFKLPDLGEGIHEGEIVDVFVSVGDQVNEGQPILSVETDKATVEIPSPYTGAVQEIRVKAGDTVKVGDVLMVFTSEKPAAEAQSPKAEKPEVTETAERKEPQKEKPAAPKPPPSPAPTTPPSTPSPTPEGRTEGPVPASPATRRLARELGVDLKQVPATGPAGLVTSEDVRAFAEGRKAPAPEAPAPPRAEPAAPSAPAAPVEAPPLPDFSQWGTVEREPLRSVRRATARHIALSWAQIPHVSHQDEADITELDAFRRKHAPDIEAQGGKLTTTVFAMKAAVAALKKFPYFNASLDMHSEEIILKRYYHVGVAVDTERGLIVPVIRDVDRKSISELSVELNSLAQKTRDGKATIEEMHGGTFTITNIGAIGGTGFAPIINYPEVAILGMAQARMRPVVKRSEAGRDEVVPRLMLPLIIAFDHRIMDGADAARFLRMVIDILENPGTLALAV